MNMGNPLLKTLPRTVHTKPILDYIFHFILFFRKILNQSHWSYISTFLKKKNDFGVEREVGMGDWDGEYM